MTSEELLTDLEISAHKERIATVESDIAERVAQLVFDKFMSKVEDYDKKVGDK